MKSKGGKSLRDFIFAWNVKFPYDRWWRKKYNIPFNSTLHRSISLIDIKMEYEEELIFIEMEEAEASWAKREEAYREGKLLKDSSIVKEVEAQGFYDNIDLGQFSHLNTEDTDE